MPSLFSDLFLDQWPEFIDRRATAPQINVIETDKKFKIEIAAPGMTKDDLKVELNNDNQLIVCMEKEMEGKGDGADIADIVDMTDVTSVTDVTRGHTPLQRYSVTDAIENPIIPTVPTDILVSDEDEDYCPF